MTETNLDNLEAPNHETVTVLPDTPTPEPITFDEKQQRFIDSVLAPRLMGRAAKDVRAELAATKERLETAEAALKASSPDTTETEKLKAELQLARAESEAVKRSAAEAARTAEIERELSKAGVIDPPLLRTAIADRVQRASDGTYTILDDAGTPRDGVTLQQFVAEESAKRPYLVKSNFIFGTGSSGSSGSAVPQRIALEQVFGSRSDSRLANQIANGKIAGYDYRRMKIEAQRKGLI